jgi:mannose-6-phosphate isomerase-like protein (cupin superfamily)
MQGAAFQLTDLNTERSKTGNLYLEFLRVPDLSTGLYVLEAGATDPQEPHTEDEVYIVMQGKGKIKVADEVFPVSTGSIVYVAANVEHRFFEIKERLEVLVFFAPAEYAKKLKSKE